MSLKPKQIANNRTTKLRAQNIEEGGENLSGTIDKEIAGDLKTIVDTFKKTQPKFSKIEAVRYAIHYTANALKKEEQ